MLAEVQWALVAVEIPADRLARKELVLDPHRHRRDERPPASGGDAQIALEQPLELQERLVVEGNGVQVANPQPAFAQTVLNRTRREALIVLFAREAFFL